MEMNTDFVKIMEGLVSNGKNSHSLTLFIYFWSSDSKTREKSLDETKEFLVSISKGSAIEDLEQYYSKIWRSFFFCNE
jgi:hypothetical protein